MSALDELYQQVLLDHYKNPRNRGGLPGATHHGAAFNPLCGDDVALHLRIEGDRIQEVRFEGKGCVLSQAAASALTEALVGKAPGEARQLGTGFEGLVGAPPVQAAGTGEDPQSLLPEALRAFAGVRAFPTRRRCALLPWRALTEALALAPAAPEAAG